MADLINTIKMSKIPIICICNDKYSQKLRSLRNHVREIWLWLIHTAVHCCRQLFCQTCAVLSAGLPLKGQIV